MSDLRRFNSNGSHVFSGNDQAALALLDLAGQFHHRQGSGCSRVDPSTSNDTIE